jgi:hypothetical protein
MTKNVDKMTENVDKMTENVDKMTENVDFIWPRQTAPPQGLGDSQQELDLGQGRAIGDFYNFDADILTVGNLDVDKNTCHVRMTPEIT